jgi:hypothetical protein
MPATRNPRDTPDPRDIQNDKPPMKGTDTPWQRPDQSSQDPSLPEPRKRDLDRWNETIKRQGDLPPRR